MSKETMTAEPLTIPVTEYQPPARQETDLLAVRDGEVVEVSEHGEVLSVSGLPPEDAGAEEVARWLGPRRARAMAKAAGLTAERNALLRQISEQYDPLIKRENSYVAFLDAQYGPLLRGLLERLLDGKKARSARVGLLNLRLRKSAVRTVIPNADLALNWLKLRGETKAVKVTETILKSEISEHVKGAMVTEGLLAYEGGDDEFSVE